MLSTLILALSLGAGSGLRLANPNDHAADAVVRCGGISRAVHIEAHGISDLAPSAVCTSPVIEAFTPIVAFETSNESIETQRLLDASTNAACEPAPMAVPLFACERGSASASVNPVNGATYAWSAEGATITSGQGTPRVTVSLGDAGVVRLTAVIAADSCSRTASGIIAVHKPLSIAELKVPASVEAGSSLTIEWTYAAGGQPASQVLKGDLFPAPVSVPADQRKYTFTPNAGGTRTVELIASHAPVISTVTQPKGGRRRAAGSTLVTATNCAEVHAAKQLTVRCNAIGPAIQTANDVESGVAFTARVTLEAGETASWSVTGGTILSGAESEEVEVVPDDLITELQLGVTVARANSCSVESHSTLRVRPRQSCTAHPPSANVSLVGRACKSAMVQANFTGTPPFRGTWSDGKTFATYDNSLTREFTIPGDYTILGFSDAQCPGEATSTARVDSFYPSVVLTTDDACEGATVTAHFTGKPPFRGRWLPGEWFDTNESTLTTTVPVGWPSIFVEYLTDANCPEGGEGATSNTIYLRAHPETWMDPGPVCISSTPGFAAVHFTSDRDPWSVQWSDGVVTTATQHGWPVVTRDFLSTKWNDTIEIARAWDASCEAVVKNKVVDLTYRPAPRIDSTDVTTCVDGTMKVALQANAPLHPDTILTWSATNAEILSGQGTREITVKATQPGWTARVAVQATFPDGYCSEGRTDSIGVYVATPPQLTNVVAEPATIKAGGETAIKFTLAGDVEYFTLHTTEAAREGDIDMLNGSCNAQRVCSFPFKDTHGPGNVTVQIYYGGHCNRNPPPATASFTVTP
jgi:PKD domain-containing protein